MVLTKPLKRKFDLAGHKPRKAKVETYEDGVTHIHTQGYSVNINIADNGICVDIWEPGFEGAAPLSSTHVWDESLPSKEPNG